MGRSSGAWGRCVQRGLGQRRPTPYMADIRPRRSSAYPARMVEAEHPAEAALSVYVDYNSSVGLSVEVLALCRLSGSEFGYIVFVKLRFDWPLFLWDVPLDCWPRAVRGTSAGGMSWRPVVGPSNTPPRRSGSSPQSVQGVLGVRPSRCCVSLSLRIGRVERFMQEQWTVRRIRGCALASQTCVRVCSIERLGIT